MKQVRCKSGLKGWQAKLRKNYSSLEEFKRWDENYGISSRLGFETSEEAWEANPLIRGSVDPEDLEIVK